MAWSVQMTIDPRQKYSGDHIEFMDFRGFHVSCNYALRYSTSHLTRFKSSMSVLLYDNQDPPRRGGSFIKAPISQSF
jgi:hypothetical protein